MKIAITGHRPNKLGNDYDLKSALIFHIRCRIIDILQKYTIEDLILISGMALGIDTLFAKIAIENNIPFIAAIPCVNQNKMWPQSSKNTYNDIINSHLCKQVFITDKEYTNKCMQLRNEWMVDNCDILIAVWNGTTGGTANCVKYAQSVGKEIIYINPDAYK